MNLESALNSQPIPASVIYIVYIWSLFWKGIALWKASQNKQRNWFIVLLVVNAAGILELIYLFKFAKKRLTLSEMKGWFVKETK